MSETLSLSQRSLEQELLDVLYVVDKAEMLKHMNK